MSLVNDMQNLVEGIVQTIPSYEVAKMMEKEHKEVLQYIEGRKDKEGKTLVTGIIEVLESEGLHSQDFFIKSTYKAEGNNKTYKCYDCTKMGCEMLANKMTGTKGIIFTARYVKRFNDMEQYIKQQVPQLSQKQMLQLRILNGNEIERIGALKEYENVITKPLNDTIEKQSEVIGELAPKASYTDRVLEDKDTLLTITQIAKDYGMSGQEMNNLLHDLGVQYKQNNQWLLYSKYQGKGYVKTYQPDIKNAKPQTRWTQAGKMFIYETLKKRNLKTVYEKELERTQVQQHFDFN